MYTRKHDHMQNIIMKKIYIPRDNDTDKMKYENHLILKYITATIENTELTYDSFLDNNMDKQQLYFLLDNFSDSQIVRIIAFINSF
jgi:hypothetical protein